MTREVLGSRSICPHQNIARVTDDAYPRHWSLFSRCVDQAFTPLSPSMYGACPRCATAFVVDVRDHTVYLEAYYNLGPEALAMSSNWNAVNWTKEALDEKYFGPGMTGIPYFNPECPMSLFNNGS